MKKKILFIIITIVGLFLITGCTDTPVLDNEISLDEYLSKHYPSEKFDVVSLDENKVDKKSNHCKYTGVEKIYTVKSLDSSITFTVKDDCKYDLYGFVYRVEDDYLEKANEKLLNDNINTKANFFDLYDDRVYAEFGIDDYSTKEEMANDIWNIVTQLKSKYPYRNQNILDESKIEIKYRKDYSNSFFINEINSISDVNIMVGNDNYNY